MNIVEHTRLLRQKIINLNNKKRKLIEDKNKHAVKLINIEYNELIGVYIEYSIQSLKTKKM